MPAPRKYNFPTKVFSIKIPINEYEKLKKVIVELVAKYRIQGK